MCSLQCTVVVLYDTSKGNDNVLCLIYLFQCACGACIQNVNKWTCRLSLPGPRTGVLFSPLATSWKLPFAPVASAEVCHVHPVSSAMLHTLPRWNPNLLKPRQRPRWPQIETRGNSHRGRKLPLVFSKVFAILLHLYYAMSWLRWHSRDLVVPRTPLLQKTAFRLQEKHKHMRSSEC